MKIPYYELVLCSQIGIVQLVGLQPVVRSIILYCYDWIPEKFKW